jgi:hypothetical protein
MAHFCLQKSRVLDILFGFLKREWSMSAVAACGVNANAKPFFSIENAVLKFGLFRVDLKHFYKFYQRPLDNTVTLSGESTFRGPGFTTALVFDCKSKKKTEAFAIALFNYGLPIAGDVCPFNKIVTAVEVEGDVKYRTIEFWPTPIHRIEFEITAEQFAQMKQQIEEDRRKDEEIFQLIGNNCTLYVSKIGQIGGIDLPNSIDGWRVLAPSLQRPVDFMARYLPALICRIVAVVTAFLINIALLFCGVHKIDVQLKGRVLKPHVNSWVDIFDPKKLVIDHPHTVAYRTMPLVRKWRLQQNDLAKAAFAIPPRVELV